MRIVSRCSFPAAAAAFGAVAIVGLSGNGDVYAGARVTAGAARRVPARERRAEDGAGNARRARPQSRVASRFCDADRQGTGSAEGEERTPASRRATRVDPKKSQRRSPSAFRARFRPRRKRSHSRASTGRRSRTAAASRASTCIRRARRRCACRSACQRASRSDACASPATLPRAEVFGPRPLNAIVESHGARRRVLDAGAGGQHREHRGARRIRRERRGRDLALRARRAHGARGRRAASRRRQARRDIGGVGSVQHRHRVRDAVRPR